MCRCSYFHTKLHEVGYTGIRIYALIYSFYNALKRVGGVVNIQTFKYRF